MPFPVDDDDDAAAGAVASTVVPGVACGIAV